MHFVETGRRLLLLAALGQGGGKVILTWIDVL